MASFYEAAIRLTAGSDRARIVRELGTGPRAQVWHEGDYLRASWRAQTPWSLLCEISQLTATEIVATSEQTVSSVFEFRRFRDGRELRRIAFLEGWVAVEGEPESWEAAVLFGPDQLESELESAETEEEAAQLQAQFASHVLRVGQPWPAPPHGTTVSLFEALGIPLRNAASETVAVGSKRNVAVSLVGFAGCALCFVSGVRQPRLDELGGVGFAIVLAAAITRPGATSVVTRVGGGLLIAIAGMLAAFLLGRVFG